MTKLHFYELFNEKTDELFKDLITSYPEVEQFRHWRSGLSLLKNVDNKGPQRIFKSHIDNYREYILAKNEEFFLTNGSIEVKTDQEYWNDFMNHIRGMWKTLGEENKEVIWKYFHVLVVLSDKCTSV